MAEEGRTIAYTYFTKEDIWPLIGIGVVISIIILFILVIVR